MKQPNGKLALGLLLTVITIFLGLAIWILPDRPTQVVEDFGATSVNFSLSDQLVFGSDTCVVASWQVEGVRTLRFNDAGVIGADSRSLCTTPAELEIELADGTKQTFLLERRVAFDLAPVRFIMVLAVGLLAAAALFAPITRRFLLVDRPAGRLVSSVRPAGALLIVGVLVLIGVALRVDFLSAPMRTDESWTFNEFISAPLAQSLTNYRTTNNHLLHTILARLSYLTFGNEPWILRLPAFFAGILMIPLTFRVGLRFYGWRAALLATGLVAVSSHLVAYSTNARGYTLMTVCFLGLLWITPTLAREGRPRRWLIFCALTVAGFYTVPTMLYAFAVVWLWLALTILHDDQPRKARRIGRLVLWSGLAGVVTLALYAPALVSTFLVRESSLSLNHLGTLPWQSFVNSTADVMRIGWQVWNTDLSLPVSALLVAGFIVAVVFHRQTSRQAVAIAPLAIIVCLLLVFAQLNNTYIRLWLFLLPLYFIVAAGGVCLIARWLFSLIQTDRTAALRPAVAWSILVIGLTLVLAIQVHNTRSPKFDGETGSYDEADQIAEILKDALQPTDYVLCSESCHQLGYYLTRAGVTDVSLGHSGARLHDRRVFIVVVHSRQTMEDVLRHGITPDRFETPVLLRRFDTSALYVAEPL